MSKNRIKDLREDHDLDQKDICKVLGISQQYYSRYETGKIEIPLRHYITLAKYYNVSIDYLAGVIDTPKPLRTNKELTAKQSALIKSYENNVELQPAIDKLLNL